MEQTKIKIGYVPVRRDVFSAPAAMEQRKIIAEQLNRWDICQIADIDGINSEGLLYDESDLEQVVSYLKQEQVDGVFFPHCNFGCEALVGKVAKALGKPVLLWGPRDGAPKEDGTRERDSQCGLFASSKVLRRMQVPFTYITNSHVTDKVFRDGFRDFVSVCAVVKAFQRIRILQVSTRPDCFWTMMSNEGELLERFGIEVHPVTFVDVEEFVQYFRQHHEEELYQEAEKQLLSSMDCSGASEAEIETLAALKASLKQLAARYRCTAIAVQCWFSMQKSLGIMPCVANGLLTEEGIPTVCETDLHGAVSSILLQEAARGSKPVFFADMTVRHPANDQAELLWHCGNFPPSLSRHPEKNRLDNSFILDSHCSGIGVWEIRGGDITVCRFDGDNGDYRLLIGEGKGVEGPENKGTYVWFEVKDWAMWEERLIRGPYVHHCTGIHGSYAHVLLEACRYIPGLKADAVEPSEDELLRRMRE